MNQLMPESLFIASQAHYSRAQVHRLNGEYDEWRQATIDTYALQLECAEMLKDKLEAEPTRSIVYMSCAGLALSLGMYHKSLELANEGLNGAPEAWVKSRLHRIMETCVAMLDDEQG